MVMAEKKAVAPVSQENGRTTVANILLSLYFNLPPLLNSTPSVSYAGNRAHNAKLNPYHPKVPRTASTLIKPAQPGQPTSSFNVSIPCCHPDFVDRRGAVNSFPGDSSAGAGQPVTSLQTNANK